MIIFQDPPKPGRAPVKEQARELRANPNRTAIIRTYPREQMRAAHNYAHHINSGRLPSFAGCRARACTEGDVTNVYAWWEGER